jgi:hypothetical protein
MDYETLIVRQEGAVLFAAINSPPINLLGPELVRDLESLIQRAEADGSIQVLQELAEANGQGARGRGCRRGARGGGYARWPASAARCLLLVHEQDPSLGPMAIVPTLRAD